MNKQTLKHTNRSLLLAAALSVPFASQVLAHHPVQAKFDTASELSLSGVVTKVDWRNPHAHIFINVQDGDSIVNWAVELESPLTLTASGWDRNTVSPGDHISVKGIQARNGSRQLWGESMLMAANGKPLFTITDNRPVPPLVPRPAPRHADGTVALGGTSAGSDGYWGFPSKYSLIEDGVDVAIDQSGQLQNLADVSKVAPLQDWALAIYKHRQQRMLQDDPTFRDCKPYAGPRQYQSDFGIKLVEDIPGERIFVLMGSGNHNYRIIYLDGREQTGQVTGDDDNPLFFGRSVGHWEGDTLVVNTTGFNENFWFSNGGLPHTSMLTLHEKFTRPDMETLHYEVTVEDPGAYTRNWTASWDMQWVGGQELPVHLCQENRP